METPTTRRGIPLHTKILLGLLLGAVAGVASNALWGGSPRLDWAIDNVANPIGQVFLRMLFMVVIPLVFSTLALGVASLGDLSRLGRIGGKTIGFFVFTTAIAVALGLTLANVVRPGERIDEEVRTGLLATYAEQASTTTEAVSGGVHRLER